MADARRTAWQVRNTPQMRRLIARVRLAAKEDVSEERS
jgi:hypothetical protein